MTSYAITGASGQLGLLATEQLLSAVDPSDVVLLTRSPDSLARFADRGASVRQADFEDPTSLVEALAGVDRLLLISVAALGEERRAMQRSAVDAAVKAGVERVVYTSLPRPDAANPVVVADDHRDTEEYLRASGLKWIALGNNLYSDLQVDVIRRAADTGQLITNNGTGRAAYVTRADCAAAAVAALTGDHVDIAYDITGPDALDSHDLAAIASSLRGSHVAVVDVDDDAFSAGLVGAGVPDELAHVLTTFGTSIREGWLADASGDVARLTGVEPTPLRDLF